ncbi:LuxR family transcriptional regulator [Methylobacterium sp. Leaf469]|jgi:DNA-binding NarL/FixJ family response regulator|uniref:response regulator transcription factor n=1 Tax=unclassified Methylobacterium TaxID=2615210 RepID=UPI0006F3BD68|nr:MULTISPECIES: DNA-binding response regulator [unclassified Methylobacterium]USU32097.1 DNA-binding response regulator [Methylobacterium sp. OTU13CASTA1]KQO72128.1 LuxR family transcriptional regulator [Methylobacterium sp. Leaf87]KQP25158.1 LuxR family transcriptional regulator [Methylobacterium sp. Leaf102]KQP58943.1 LuxR family transcriptional regulator [Methylobacterium sp. Leaf112]KQT87760.1 LuxR family transcriptional regulator [Methylobacterium sp. Leaf469]
MREPQRDIVLVVDDSPDTLSFLTDAIERSGATVLVAVAGDLALALVDEITPDIILLDAVMPGMDGFETCRHLKAKGHLAHVPVIFMTGLSETEHIVKGLEAGGVDYVTKPIAPDEILARIRVHLAGARAAQSARAALDTTGRTLFAVDGQGAVLWSTPQAARLLAGFGDPGAGGLPPQGRDWLRGSVAGTVSAPLTLTDRDGVAHTLSFIGGTGDEILLRLARDPVEAGIERLRARLPVTGREAEVLLWLSRGKASRDIGEILGLSPRTVTKHLEGIYAKLGVENRTAASLIAARHLQDLG